MRRLASLIAVLASLLACDRLTPPPAHERAEAPQPKPSAPAPGSNEPAADVAKPPPKPIEPGELPEVRDHYPAPERLVAIGDVHGDLQATRRALRLAGAIDESDRWIGGELVIVQTGDQLDRGDDEQAILELLARLQHEAHAAGGAVHVLNGNHEYMNALGDLRYVTPGGLADFEDAPGVNVAAPELARILDAVPERARARVAAFWPGQPWAHELSKRNMIVVVGDSVFVHGGITPAWAGKVAEINAKSRAWLAGKSSEPPEAVTDSDGPVWSRRYAEDVDAQDCASLDEALGIIGVKRMIVGHTVHKEGITSACDDKVWRIDVGMAAHYGGPTQVLEIRGDQLTVLGG